MCRRTGTVPAGAGMFPHDFAETAGRLADANHSVRPGNPAASTRGRLGPLYLEVGNRRAAVPEELSAWEAIGCAPSRLRVLKNGPEFDAFCSIAIKAVENANAFYGTCIAVGIDPQEWAGFLSLSTVKKLSAFLTEVRTEAAGAGGDWDDLVLWRRIWTRRPIPGFVSADALWTSALGYAVRHRPRPGGIDPVRLPEPPDSDGEQEEEGGEFDPAVVADRLDRLFEAGVLDDYDRWLLNEIFAGKDLAELAVHERTIARLERDRVDPEVYLEDLTERILAWIAHRLGDDED
ncbi:MAG: hypothetical protein ACREC6_09360 [Hyphomicrobiaceae bacterium]